MSAVWGVMRQLGRDHRGWPSGKGSGSVTSRAAPPIAVPLEDGDQGSGVDVAAAGHVDQPGVVPHQGQFRGRDDALGLGGEGQGDENDLGLRERECSSADGTVRSAPSTGSVSLRTTVACTPNGASSANNSLVIPPPPRMVTGRPKREMPAGCPQDRARARSGSSLSPARARQRACSATGRA